MFERLRTDAESDYIKALLDPFHPKSRGARVPMLLPRPSVTYSVFKQINVPNNQDLLIFANLQLGAQQQAVTIPVIANLLTRTPVAVGNATWWAGAPNPYNVHYISLGTSNYIKANATGYSDNTPSELFTK